MKLFMKQLGLLLWKNLRLRRRQMVRNIVEIFWPLAIFLILVSVRHKRPPEKKPMFENKTSDAIYFVPRALPSAGALPFLQSIFCDYKLSEYHPEPKEIPDFRNSVFNTLIRDLSPILTNQTRLNYLQNAAPDLEALANDLTKIYDRYNRTGELPVRDLFGSQIATSLELQNILGLSPNVSDALSKSSFKLDGLLNVTGLNASNIGLVLSNITILTDDFKKKLCDEDGVARIFDFPAGTNTTEVKKGLCSVTELELEALGVVVLARSTEILGDIMNITGISEADVNRTIIEFLNVGREVL